jgi:hypothetical protein
MFHIVKEREKLLSLVIFMHLIEGVAYDIHLATMASEVPGHREKEMF